MQGQLAETTTVDLCRRLAAEGTTGTLVVSGPTGQADLVFADGHLAGGRAPAVSGGASRLGERLVAVGRLDPAALEQVLAEQTADPAAWPLGQRLVDRGLVSDDVVRLCLQEQALDALQEVVGWLDGTWRVEVTERRAGVAVSMPVDRALREVARRTVDRQQMALQRVGQPADRESTTPSSREEFDLSAAPTTGTRPAAPTDGGWTHPLDTSPPGAVDEPEPWIGWAHGAPPAPEEAQEALQVLPEEAHTPSRVEPSHEVEDTEAPAAEVPRPSPPIDADTRRELFSALHEVGQAASPRPGPPAPAARPNEPAALDEATTDHDEADEVDIPVPAPPPSLSHSDVSELLAELHALNLDDDGRG